MSRRTEKLEAFFEAALALESAAQRQAYLDRACLEPDLRREVESLLAAHGNPDSLLIAQRESTEPGTRANAPITEQPGDRIGRYKLLEKLGDGGFGVVYMAEQREPVKRRVALKIIKVGMDTREFVTRFEAERQALALMDHPNIARIFDAGSTERPLTPSLSPGGGEGARRAGEGAVQEPEGRARRSARAEGQPSESGAQGTDAPYQSQSTLSAGRPYFVMELVRGIKITDYCDQNQLGMEERLKLFMQVCHAVQHAHQKGIIHRDLKPSNILVTLHDGVPVPKVIDFGIAKATQQELTEKTLFTQFHQFIGTPSYMSPEQAELSGLDIDTRSDIYSLGVLLYELLAGQTPFDGQELLKAGLDAMRRKIRQEEPPKPSTRLTQELVAAGVRRRTSKSEEEIRVSSRRLLQMKEFISVLRGDLDWIVMKALEKDRTRRYETANGLAADIQRHLSNEPVVARPPSAAYRFQKLVRRNKIAFAASTAVAAALMIGLTISLWLFLKERDARAHAVAQQSRAEAAENLAAKEGRKAAEEAAIATAVNDFLRNDLLRAAGSDYQADVFQRSVAMSKQRNSFGKWWK